MQHYGLGAGAAIIRICIVAIVFDMFMMQGIAKQKAEKAEGQKDQKGKRKATKGARKTIKVEKQDDSNSRKRDQSRR